MTTWFSNLEIIHIVIADDGVSNLEIIEMWYYICNLAYDEYMILKSWNYTNWWFIVYVILWLLSIWWM